MRTLTLIAIAASLITGCAGYPSKVEENLGQAVLGVRAQQTINPDAPLQRHPLQATDGQAAKSSIDRYQKSFDTPPPPVTVLNIGVGSGSAGQ